MWRLIDQLTTGINGGLPTKPTIMGKWIHSNCSTAPYHCYQEQTQAGIPNYWSYAKHFVLNDNTFTSLIGPSFPNHQYTIAAKAGSDANNTVINNPLLNGKPVTQAWGCDSPTGT